MRTLLIRYPELGFTMLVIAITCALSVVLALPISFPSGERAAFVGVHYLYPLIGLCIWAGLAAVGQKRQLFQTFLIALPCYAAVLLCHFNIKLWIPHINPVLWDDVLWASDQSVRPLIDASFVLRKAIAPIIPLGSNFYMFGFIILFYVSFCYHAIKTPEKFRTFFLAALFLQGFGAFAYLIMPAIGPFIYEAGIEAQPTLAQASMYGAYQANFAGGAEWLREYGGAHLTVGLAAMPSLHAGASFLFLIFAAKYARVLVVPYLLIFAYICVAAISSRWHYAIDLPVGMALAWVSSVLAHRLIEPAQASHNSTPDLFATDAHTTPQFWC